MMKDIIDWNEVAPCLGLGCAQRAICSRYRPEARALQLIRIGCALWLGNPDHTLSQCPGFSLLQHPTPADQPDPVPNAGPAIWDLVIADMHVRDQIGADRYGTRLQPFNGRDALRDAYEEALDQVCYLRQALYERDHGA